MKATNLLILLLLATAVYAANVTITPATVYETTKEWQTLSVNNYKGTSAISKVTITSPSLLITDAENYLGWTTTQDANSAAWKDGSIGSNIKNAAFEFEVSAPAVSGNTTVNVTVSLDSTTRILAIKIIDDSTPPVVSDVTPNDYARANNNAQPISVNVTDAETSVANVTYSYNNCIGGPDITVSLAKAGDLYTGTADFSAFDEGMKACYKITAKNLPGETAIVNGTLQFDGTPPVVAIISPTNFTTEATTFVYSATDNIAAILSCELKFDTTSLGTVNLTNGTTASIAKNLTGFDEGSQTWKVTCTDGVGLSSTQSQTVLLDTQPPNIALNTSMILRTVSNSFTATITDTVGISSVDATFDGSPVDLAKSGDKYTGSINSSTLGNKLLVVEATDNVGRVSTKTINVTVVPNHVLTLSLSSAHANPGDTITASGTLNPDGNTTVDKVTVKALNNSNLVSISSGTYSTAFTAPDTGSYVISAEFIEGGYTYKATAILSVTEPGQTQQQLDNGNGIGADAWRTSGYVKPDEQPQDDNDNSNQQTETTEDSPAPETAYVPLPPEAPRSAYTPNATGVFNLGKTAKWLSLLLAAGLLVGIGAYAWGKRKPKEDDGIDWGAYFKQD